MAERTCSHPDGCDRPWYCGDWCNMHYHRVRKHGEPGPLHSYHGIKKFCSVYGCEREIGPEAARGWCALHYQRWRKTGDPRINRRDDYRDRLLGFTAIRSDGCIEWTSTIMGTGYGRIGRKPAHIAMYEWFVGPFPRRRYQLHHTCERKWCVAPQHLVPLTQADHNRVHAGVIVLTPELCDEIRHAIRDGLEADEGYLAVLHRHDAA